jgi:hypothetical protein
MKEISRKKFLRTAGSVVAGGAIAGVSGFLLSKGYHAASPVVPAGNFQPSGEEAPVSPYRLMTSFAVSGAIRGMEQYGGKIYVATDRLLHVFNTGGKRLHHFSIGDSVRDIAVGDEGVYVLYPSGIEVYTEEGGLLREWAACSDDSSYCAFAVAQGYVFVTDMAYKNICKYTVDGDFVKFIQSPDAFIIPSLTFGIECVGDVLYCSNSGRHRVERYTLDGEYLGSFGEPGGAPGRFAGCCNPVHLAYTSNGDIITSEKGNPRISCYGSDGQFHGVLLDSKSLGGGHAAYDVKVRKDRVFVAGKDRVSVFRYDGTRASTAACSGCGIDCPLVRRG